MVATGAHPRPLPGAAAVRRACTPCGPSRTAIALGQAARRPSGARVVVVGAGFIGSEVAATCRGLGAPGHRGRGAAQPLARVLGDEMGAACGALHRDHGVELRTGVGVAALRAPRARRRRRSTAVELDDGTVLDADVVVVGIGVVPTTEWLEGSGLEIDNGVVCRRHAARRRRRGGGRRRGPLVRPRARAPTSGSSTGPTPPSRAWPRPATCWPGAPTPSAYVPVPYFWSDQYDVKIQVIGHPSPDDEVVVVDGSVDERRFVALYGRAGRLTAALGFSRPRQLMGYRPLLEAGASFDEALAQRPA